MPIDISGADLIPLATSTTLSPTPDPLKAAAWKCPRCDQRYTNGPAGTRTFVSIPWTVHLESGDVSFPLCGMCSQQFLRQPGTLEEEITLQKSTSPLKPLVLRLLEEKAAKAAERHVFVERLSNLEKIVSQSRTQRDATPVGGPRGERVSGSSDAPVEAATADAPPASPRAKGKR